MSGDPKRSSYRARKLGYYTKGPTTIASAMVERAKLSDPTIKTFEDFKKSYILQQGSEPSPTPKPSD